MPRSALLIWASPPDRPGPLGSTCLSFTGQQPAFHNLLGKERERLRRVEERRRVFEVEDLRLRGRAFCVEPAVSRAAEEPLHKRQLVE